jgi:hypothetical protein
LERDAGACPNCECNDLTACNPFPRSLPCNRLDTANAVAHLVEKTSQRASSRPLVGKKLLRGIGLLAIAVCTIGFWQRRSFLTVVELYLLGFALIVFAYPWFDTRLWLPVIPFLMIYFLLGARQIASPRLLRPLLWGHSVGFALLGILALGYSSRLTLACAQDLPTSMGTDAYVRRIKLH